MINAKKAQQHDLQESHEAMYKRVFEKEYTDQQYQRCHDQLKDGACYNFSQYYIKLIHRRSKKAFDHFYGIWFYCKWSG